MISSLRNYRDFGRDYTYSFDGDDQLNDLNTSVRDLTEENKNLRKRISAMKRSFHKKEQAG